MSNILTHSHNAEPSSRDEAEIFIDEEEENQENRKTPERTTYQEVFDHIEASWKIDSDELTFTNKTLGRGYFGKVIQGKKSLCYCKIEPSLRRM